MILSLRLFFSKLLQLCRWCSQRNRIVSTRQYISNNLWQTKWQYRGFFSIFFSKFLHCLHFQVLCFVCAVLIWASAMLIISTDQTRPSYLLIFSFCSLDFIMSLFDMWSCLSIIVCLLGLSYFLCVPTVEDDPFHFGNDMFLILFCLSKLRLALWEMFYFL